MIGKAVAFVRERIGGGVSEPRTIAGGPSLAYVFGWVLVFLIVLEGLTGAALSAFYSPSSTDAWASVAYIQDQSALGWFVRGLHVHGASALAIVAGIHLVQTGLFGAYRKPRELTWWIGIALMVLVLAWAVTGYVLRWDQAGYQANRVEVEIAAGTPIIGKQISALALGGNDYGNLTLTRFYTLHVIVMPALFVVLTILHVKWARRHGTMPAPGKDDAPAIARGPGQGFRNVVAMAVSFALLCIYVAWQHGADLAGPADPSSPYDARPLWYFRWLYVARTAVPSGLAKPVALAAPAIVVGFLAILPLVDRGPDRRILAPKRRLFTAAFVAMLALISAMTIGSVWSDAHDAELTKRMDDLDKQAQRARQLAIDNGVPTSGGLDVYATPPMYRARTLYAQRCKGCHDASSKDRKGPIIAIGHGGRDWLAGFLKDPSGDAYWGHAKLGNTDDAMKPDGLADADRADMVEYLYAQTGATDTKPDAIARGAALWKGKGGCSDCHEIDEGKPGTSAPGLAGLGSRDYYQSFISNPKSALHMTADHSQMPRFDSELSIVDRDAIAGYLVWLRTATPHDLDALGPL